MSVLSLLVCTCVCNCVWGVEGGLSVKALDCGSKGPGFQSHLQQRFISLLGALSPTPKIEQKVYLRVLWRGH